MLLLSTAVGATTLTPGFEIEFSGGTPPAGATPWVTATSDDSYGSANDVRLTMSAGNLVLDESVSKWYFDFDPSRGASAESGWIGAAAVATR